MEPILHLESCEGQHLLAMLEKQEIFLEKPCNGKGTCGKCLVKVVEGNIEAASVDEQSVLGPEMIAAGYRLACLIYPEEDIFIVAPKETRDDRILAEGKRPDFKYAPSVQKVFVPVYPGDTNDHRSAETRIRAMVDFDIDPLGLRCARALSAFHTESAGGQQSATLVFDGRQLLAIEPGDTRRRMYGLAFDIGTTTIIGSLVNLINGRELCQATLINPQTRQGLDVLSRIAFAQENGAKGCALLQNSLVTAIKDLGLKLCHQYRVKNTHIYNIVIAANTTMLHLLLGLQPDSLGTSPFAPTLTRSMALNAAELSLDVFPEARIYTLPSVSAYIGADIVAGAYVCSLQNSKQNILFMDIGTNGEIILAAGGQLLSCSCAAGPALEGMNIHHGMRAAAGAIEDLRIHWNPDAATLDIQLKTIGEVPATGLCGSGILAAVRELLNIGLIRPNGCLVKADDLPETDLRRPLCMTFNHKPAIEISRSPHQVIITQKDVRQVQLAKGAILSAFETLLNKGGLTMHDIDRVLVAGQFGAYLPTVSLTACGIIPRTLEDRIEFWGNTSKAGAYMALMSQSVRNEMEQLAQEIDYYELATHPGYERLFSAAMMFPAPAQP